MSDIPPQADFASLDLFPFTDQDDVGDVELPVSFGTPVAEHAFRYLGQALTAEAFSDYVRQKDFGSMPPDFVVLHHTAVPYTLGARPRATNPALAWDAKEEGLSESEIRDKRLKQLYGMKEYYRKNLFWDRGPHLFIDDRYIYLFSDMYDQGIHAKEGNGYRKDGRLHYSVGIEVLGDYTSVRWSEATARLVGHVIAVLKQKLGTFDIKHKRFAGGISSHRDYNKPACPGNAISNDYYLQVAQGAWERLTAPAPTLSEGSPVLGAASGTQALLAAYLKARLPETSEYRNDVDTILGYYWKHAPAAGVDPFLAAIHCLAETDDWQSAEAARPRRNPARLGENTPGGVQSFASWDESVLAHVNALREQGQGGKSVRDLKGEEYAARLASKAQAVARG